MIESVLGVTQTHKHTQTSTETDTQVRHTYIHTCLAQPAPRILHCDHNWTGPTLSTTCLPPTQTPNSCASALSYTDNTHVIHGLQDDA